MIRSYAPVVLIPAAWVLTFATVVYPVLGNYLIRHMHFFMLIFLTGFIALSWREMEEGVLETWRGIMVLGILSTGISTVGFYMDSGRYLFLSGVLYWIVAPAYGFYVTSEEIELFSGEYRKMAFSSVLAASIFVSGWYLSSSYLLGASFLLTGLIQFLSMFLAVKMES